MDKKEKKMIALQLDSGTYNILKNYSLCEDRSLSSLIRSILRNYTQNMKGNK